MSSEQIGSLSVEAAKLIASLQIWTRGVGWQATKQDDWSAHDHEGPHDVEQHMPLECRICPLCTVGRLVRTLTPEIQTHIASAGMSFAMAIKGLLEGIGDDEGTTAATKAAAVPTSSEPLEKFHRPED